MGREEERDEMGEVGAKFGKDSIGMGSVSSSRGVTSLKFKTEGS